MTGKHTWIFYLLGFSFLIFSLLPTGYEISRRSNLRPDRSFELVHNFPTDYNFYLSRIRQGIEGRITIIEQYTSEPHKGSFIHAFYLILGRVGRWVRVPWERGGDVYHMARVVLGATVLFLIAQFARRSFKSFPWQVIAFLLAVTASTWPKVVFEAGGWRFGGYMAWWSVMDSLQRITFIPHLLAGQALILTLPMFFGRNWVFPAVMGFLLGMIFPPGLIFVYATLGIMAVFDRKYVKPLINFFLLSIPSLIYLQLMTTFMPWNRLAQVDIIRPLPFDYTEYIKAVGPILPLGLLGLIMALVKKEKSMNLAISWVFAWISLLAIFRFIPSQSPLRFSEMIPHVPLAILAAYLFTRLKYVKIVPIFLIGIGLFHMYSSWLWQRDFVDHKIRATLPLVPTGAYVMYPLKDFLSAMKFIQDNTKRNDIILSETTAGNYMPVYSGNTVYIGHDNTVNFEEKKETVKQFFSGKMKVEQAKNWMQENNLKVIFFGPQEREDGGVKELEKVYPFLTPVYRNTYVTVLRRQ